ncbi:MAG: HTH domain-containing protein [Streptosporangiales bacterium]|nr:HTH domain-containing protein [Streptosporangiales bacterium]
MREAPTYVHPMIPRVERHHRILDQLRAAAPRTVPVTELATTLGVSARSIERDVRLLRDAGLPLRSTRGPRGGYRLEVRGARLSVELTAGEAAVLVASLVGIGPLASATAQSALDKLVGALAS